MKYQIITFGCQMNSADSLWLDTALTCRGHQQTQAAEEADFFIVNTCSVREKPEQKVYSLLGRLRDYHDQDSRVFVCVGGCVAQQAGRTFLERFPFVRLVFGTDALARVPQVIEDLEQDPDLKLCILDLQQKFTERAPLIPINPQPQAFVNIMQGCDNFCAYCIVPYTRGRQKSRDSSAVINECRRLAALGTREITLLGQNVNSYGLDNPEEDLTFTELLEEIAALPGLNRLRFTTSHPKDVSRELIQAFGRLDALCPALHLPLQSGSDRILRAMGRGYTSGQYLEIINRLRQVRPDITLTTDLMVGFPGETQEDFEQTLAVMDSIGYDSSFSFRYSDRPGVRAASMEPKVSLEVKTRRLNTLQKLQQDWTRRKLESRVGIEDSVLILGPSKKQKPGACSWTGKDSGGRTVNIDFNTQDDQTGKLVRVVFTRAGKHSLEGELLP
ncbi:MAG: tRNA (N6-isopentenyl adenosine(37)-C2)-methylthiotransferase MiaB [Desulfonatronovibrionaceae bacterium]